MEKIFKAAFLKDTYKEKAPSNKTLALTKSRNMDIWIVDRSNRPVVRGFKLKQNLQKNKIVNGKTPFFVIGPFYTNHFICFNIGLYLFLQFFMEITRFQSFN